MSRMTHTPADERELSQLLAGAERAVRIVGGDTRRPGAVPDGETLGTSAMRGVTHYEPGALTLVAKAGTPMAEISAVLAQENQRLAFEPMDHRPLLATAGEPTIGGVVAANVSGPRRIQAGACRDHLLGVRFVDGRGRIIKNGGQVMKNVTGYDLVKLMAGSFGTLGVLSEVSFKVQAIPQTEATVLVPGLDIAAGIAVLARALGSPYDVSGVAHVPAGQMGAQSLTAIRIEGMKQSVAYRVEKLRSLAGGDVIEAADSAAFWVRIRDAEPLARQDGAIWRISLKPSHAPAFVQQLQQLGLDHEALFDWGGGLIWLAVTDAADAGNGDAGARVIRQILAALGGHATLVRGADDLRARIPVFQPQPARIASISENIRKKFDPRGILNPGLKG